MRRLRTPAHGTRPRPPSVSADRDLQKLVDPGVSTPGIPGQRSAVMWRSAMRRAVGPRAAHQRAIHRAPWGTRCRAPPATRAREGHCCYSACGESSGGGGGESTAQRARGAERLALWLDAAAEAAGEASASGVPAPVLRDYARYLATAPVGARDPAVPSPSMKRRLRRQRRGVVADADRRARAAAGRRRKRASSSALNRH